MIDAIDSVVAKAALIAWCKRRKLPITVTGAAGGQTDPTRIRTADLTRTEHDPLLAKVRARLRRDHGFSRNPRRRFSVECVYSDEQLVYPDAEGEVCHTKPGAGESTRSIAPRASVPPPSLPAASASWPPVAFWRGWPATPLPLIDHGEPRWKRSIPSPASIATTRGRSTRSSAWPIIARPRNPWWPIAPCTATTASGPAFVDVHGERRDAGRASATLRPGEGILDREKKIEGRGNRPPRPECRGLAFLSARAALPSSSGASRALPASLFGFLHLLLQIILDAHLVDQAKLGFQVIDVLFLVIEDALEQVTGDVILDLLAVRDGVDQVGARFCSSLRSHSSISLVFSPISSLP